MTKVISKLETAHDTIKQENVPCAKYKLEDNRLQDYEAHNRLKINKGNTSKKKRHGCPECGKQFSRIGNLKSHQIIHTGEHPYGCDQCDRFFARLISLKIHKLKHMERIKFNCPFCNKSYLVSTKLKVHILTHSTIQSKKDMKIFHCERNQCEFEATSKFALFHHIEDEHKGFRYDCDQCNYKTKRKASRDMHIESIHKGTKYNCYLCDFQTS